MQLVADGGNHLWIAHLGVCVSCFRGLVITGLGGVDGGEVLCGVMPCQALGIHVGRDILGINVPSIPYEE